MQTNTNESEHVLLEPLAGNTQANSCVNNERKPEANSLNRTDDREANYKSENGRQTWTRELDFIMAGIGAAVGLGNIWRFPFLCYKNGGGAFLIPYLISFVCMSIPTYILEISLGQYTSRSSFGAWNILPAFKGVGICGAVILWYITVYYIVVISWALYYLFMSLRANVPWASCDNAWNTERCFVTGMNVNQTINCPNTTSMATTLKCTGEFMKTYFVDATEEFWERNVLQVSGDIEKPGSVVTGLTISLAVAWVLVFLCLFKGIRWTGKLVYVTATLPYILLTILLVRSVMLGGAREGIVYYLKPDFSRLADGRAWIDAATQVLFSSGVGQGYLTTLNSFNEFHANPVRNGFIITTANSLTSLFGGFCVFAILGFMAKETGQPIENVVSSGPGLAFLTYPKAMMQLPSTSFWSALFFATLVFLGLDSEFACVECFITIFMDIFPHTLYKPWNRMVFLAVYCGFSFLVGLLMVTEGGLYVFQLVDHYAVCGIVLLALVLIESLVIGWVFGADRFNDAIELMIGRRVSAFIKYSWAYITPSISMVIIGFQLSTFKPLQYSNGASFPGWTIIVGVFMVMASVSWIPIIIVYEFFKNKGNITQRFKTMKILHLAKYQVHPKWKLQKTDIYMSTGDIYEP